MVQLNGDQKKNFLRFIEDYKNWEETAEGSKNTKEHRKHQNYFQERLSKEKLSQINENDFKELYKYLWASNIWGNKDWYIENKLLRANNGLAIIKKELLKLFYDEKPNIAGRYNNFKKNVKGLGSSALTELLHFVFPDRHCLWNDKPKSVLPYLGLEGLLPDNVFKYQISDGNDYEKCNMVLGLLKDELAKAGIKNADYINLDCYFWFIFIKKMPKRSKGRKKKEPKVKVKKEPEKAVSIVSHPDAEYYLLKLGEMFGYITYTADKSAKSNDVKLGEVSMATELPSFAGERDLNSARLIDVIWLGEDENPKCCFEVEHTMDITKSLNRLFQLQHFNVKFFVVSPEDKRTKYETEMDKYPFRKEKDRFSFISYEELEKLFNLGVPFFEYKNKILGD